MLNVKRSFLFLVPGIVAAGAGLLVRSYMVGSEQAKSAKQSKETII